MKKMWPNLKQCHGHCLKELKKIRMASPNKSQKPYSLIHLVRCMFGVEIAIHNGIYNAEGILKAES